MKLIFVCSGNTCRSPLAFAAWRECVRSSPELAEIEASSAGLCPDEGAEAARHAQNLALEWGEDLSSHRARMFSAEDAEADLIVTLTADQAEVIRTHFAIDEARVRVLGSFVSPEKRQPLGARLKPLWGADAKKFAAPNDDILDPFGGSLEAYSDCALQIRLAVRELALFLAEKVARESL